MEKALKYRLHLIPLLIGILVVPGLLGSCRPKPRKPDHSDLPSDVRHVAMAIIEDSPSAFAGSFSYPVQRPYPLRDIKDSAQMVKYYDTMVDDSLRHKVKDTPDSLWQQDGWRGWTLEDGSYMWVDDGKVYAFSYMSRRETEMLDSLRREEIATLTPVMRRGWVPVLCAVDSVDGAVFRIDENDSIQPALYRLSGYRSGTDLTGDPTLVLYGSLETEGTSESRLYHFKDSTGNRADYSPDLLDDDTIPRMEIVKRGRRKLYKVKPGYWLDQVEKLRRLQSALEDSMRADPDSDARGLHGLSVQ